MTGKDTKSSLNCLQILLHWLFGPSVVNTTHLLLYQTPGIWIWPGSVTSFLSVSCSESGFGSGSAVKSKAVGSVGRLAELLKTSAQTEGSGFELERRRSKRSVFLHSGVRICPQETLNEVLASHQAYYQLRGTLSHQHHSFTIILLYSLEHHYLYQFNQLNDNLYSQWAGLPSGVGGAYLKLFI